MFLKPLHWLHDSSDHGVHYYLKNFLRILNFISFSRYPTYLLKLMNTGMINVYKGVSHRVLLYVKTLEAITSETAERTRPREPRPENKVMLLRFNRNMVTWFASVWEEWCTLCVYPIKFLSYFPLPSLSCPQLRIKQTLRNNKK